VRIEACSKRACVQPLFHQPDHFPKNCCPRREGLGCESRRDVRSEQVDKDKDKLGGDRDQSEEGRSR